MSKLTDRNPGAEYLLMGNEAIARGALEAGVSVVTGYPGTPSSEIVESLARVAREQNLYVEWSTNEKVALEVAAAASFSGLRSLCVMKQNGVNVASDFLLHLSGSGTRGGIVLAACDDPGGLSSVNEGESRYFSRLLEVPLLEPGDFQEAKDMTRWAFELSEEIENLVMVRSVTRVSHASGKVRFGPMAPFGRKARFACDGPERDSRTGPVVSSPVTYKHRLQQEKLARAVEFFEQSPYNVYSGPDRPELLLITSSACNLYSREAVRLAGLEDRAGILKLGTTWPLPPRLIKRQLLRTDKIFIVEEVLPFLEENVKIMAAGAMAETGPKIFYGKYDGTLPGVGELNPDLVAAGLSRIFGKTLAGRTPDYDAKCRDLASTGAAQPRDRTFCPGCPHRASFWSIHNALQMDGRQGFVCGDIGCYAMARLSCGFKSIKTLHAMGSGIGIAGGFGKLDKFGLTQPVLAVCGDSTFYHAAMPALVNAVHHRSDVVLVILDNSGTAMTGFQPHPGLTVDAMGDPVPAVDIAQICLAMGARVEIRDPFHLAETRQTLNRLLEDRDGVRVLILRQMCALSPEKRSTGKKAEMAVDEAICLGEECGCNRLCTRIFGCPGLIWDKSRSKARIDEVICVGCGVCADICPAGAIRQR